MSVTNYLSGILPITPRLDHDGDETLYRDESGRYFLERTLRLLDYDTKNQRQASGRALVHRISPKAAVLWATVRVNATSWDLLQDARDLMEPSGAFTLDEQAAKILRGHLAANPRHDARDIVNAAVCYMLATDADFPEVVDEAKARRLGIEVVTEADVPESPTLAPMPAIEPEAVEDQPGIHRFTFDYPATDRVCGRRRAIEVSDEQMKRTGELAAIFSLTPAQFLYGLADYNDLPGQPRRADKFKDLLKAGNITFLCTDEAMAKRIERAARARHQTVSEFAAHALGGDVDMWEECMLVHPATGEVLEADCEDLYTETKNEMIAPPIGKENDPTYRQQAGRQQVRLSVWLTPAQIEYMKFPHFAEDLATDIDVPCALIPLDPEGNVVFRVGGKEVKLDGRIMPPPSQEPGVQRWTVPLNEDASLELRAFCLRHSLKPEYVLAEYCESFLNGEFLEDRTNREGTIENARWRESQAGEAGTATDHRLVVELDAEATKLLTRYLEETPWNLAAQDVVSGCLCTWIECALDNKEEAERLTGLANREEYHDGEWGYSQQAADDAMERRTGHRSELKDPNDPRTAGLGNPSEESSRRGVHDPEDVALLAASAPDAVQEHGSLADLLARRDAILREMASHDDQESDEVYSVRLDELNYLNRRIQEASDLPAHFDVPLFQQDKETSGDEQEGGK